MKCHEIIRNIRQEHVPAHKIHLTFGNCCMEVAANQKEITEKLRAYYGHFVQSRGMAQIVITVHEADVPQFDQEFGTKEPDPGKSKIKEEYIDLSDGRVVRKRLTGMVFLFGEGENLAVGPCLANISQVVNFINNRFIEWELCRGCLLGHAAGIAWKGKGLALAGFSGAGKSTLALHVMNQGASFVSNDRLMIEKKKNGLIMHGIAKLPRINPGTILNNPSLEKILTDAERVQFSGLPKDDLWKLEHKFDASIDECFGPDRFVLDAPMRVLVILNWKYNAGPTTVRRVNLAERKDLLPAFMKSVGLFFMPANGCRMPEPSEKNYMDHLSLCTVVEFAGGIDFETAAKTCFSLLEKGSL
ncbi:MAG: HprK-related kinase B [Desulfobacterales bacterium]